MNIIHVIESLEFGGAEKVAIQLATGCAALHNVAICTTKRVGELSQSVDGNIKLIHLAGKEGNDPAVIKQLTRVFREHDADLVHIHNWGVYVEAVIAAKLARVKTVVMTIHGPYRVYPDTVIDKLKLRIRHSVELLLSHFVSQFIAVSGAVKDYVMQDIGINKNKIQIIRNGVAALSANPPAQKPDHDGLRLVSIGRVAAIKNHIFMLNGLKRVLDNQLPVTLTIVGDGPELDNIKRYASQLAIDKQIDFTGFRTDIDNMLADKDVFIMTSDYEGISIAMLEAMRHGLPVIATHVGGIPETVINDVTGFLVALNDVTALADAIRLMAVNKQQRLTMGSRAYQHFMAEFNATAVIEKYLAIYSAAMA